MGAVCTLTALMKDDEGNTTRAVCKTIELCLEAVSDRRLGAVKDRF